jgi:hypothetical protein
VNGLQEFVRFPTFMVDVNRLHNMSQSARRTIWLAVGLVSDKKWSKFTSVQMPLPQPSR